MERKTKIGQSIEEAKRWLLDGELVAIPTETVYGLAANALDPTSVLKIFEAKNRPAFDPLIVHTFAASEYEKYAQVNDKILGWVEKLSPGPVTYILPKLDVIPDLVTSGHNTVGLRIPRHPLTLDLLSQISFPLAAPSANPFGYVSPTSAKHVNDQLAGKLPYILDGGTCAVGIESTILDLSGEKPRVLRLGGFDLAELEEVLGEELNDIKLSSSQPNAPGMLHSHYAPGVVLTKEGVEDLLKSNDSNKVGALRFSSYHPSLPKENQLLLSESGSIAEAAQKLFEKLRELDDYSWEIVSVEFVPNEGLGRAINDRLTRATHPR